MCLNIQLSNKVFPYIVLICLKDWSELIFLFLKTVEAFLVEIRSLLCACTEISKCTYRICHILGIDIVIWFFRSYFSMEGKQLSQRLHFLHLLANWNVLRSDGSGFDFLSPNYSKFAVECKWNSKIHQIFGFLLKKKTMGFQTKIAGFLQNQ